MSRQDISDMSGRDVAQYIRDHSLSGERIMLQGRGDTEFARGFRTAMAGIRGAVDIIENSTMTVAEAVVNTVLHGLS